MTRLAITRLREGGRLVPVAMSWRGGEESVVEGARWKYKTGTLPQVKGPIKEAIAERPGWR